MLTLIIMPRGNLLFNIGLIIISTLFSAQLVSNITIKKVADRLDKGWSTIFVRGPHCDVR
jgi:hypothetical protein